MYKISKSPLYVILHWDELFLVQVRIFLLAISSLANSTGEFLHCDLHLFSQHGQGTSKSSKSTSDHPWLLFAEGILADTYEALAGATGIIGRRHLNHILEESETGKSSLLPFRISYSLF